MALKAIFHRAEEGYPSFKDNRYHGDSVAGTHTVSRRAAKAYSDSLFHASLAPLFSLSLANHVADLRSACAVVLCDGPFRERYLAPAYLGARYLLSTSAMSGLRFSCLSELPPSRTNSISPPLFMVAHPSKTLPPDASGSWLRCALYELVDKSRHSGRLGAKPLVALFFQCS